LIGLFSDCHGDLAAFDAAYELLRGKGAKRFIFPGGRYADLDEWIAWRREKERGGRAYSDNDFLADVTSWLSAGSQVNRPPAFGGAVEEASAQEDWGRVKDKFVRTPEKDCLQYRDPAVARKAMDMLGDSLCCVVHDKNDLVKDDLLNASVFIHGKESEPKVVQIGPRFFVTAGKLTGAAEQTCGLIEHADKTLRFTAFRLDGKVLIDRQPLVVERRNKLSVK
jgi:hypothetical protein